MNDRERFLAVARFEQPDYMPIFGFSGAPGMSRGCMRKTHDRLVATGMPAHVGGVYEKGYRCSEPESWYRYWGTTGPIYPGFGIARGATPPGLARFVVMVSPVVPGNRPEPGKPGTEETSRQPSISDTPLSPHVLA